MLISEKLDLIPLYSERASPKQFDPSEYKMVYGKHLVKYNLGKPILKFLAVHDCRFAVRQPFVQDNAEWHQASKHSGRHSFEPKNHSFTCILYDMQKRSDWCAIISF